MSSIINKHISASILSADIAQLGQEVEAVLAAGADSIHFDVMDNHYVPNLTFGPVVCQSLRRYGITAPIDVHLMVQPVDALILAFAKAGATSITFHPEASLHVDRSLQLIRDQGCQSGLALNPSTSLDCLTYVKDKLDYLLVMTVNPGFGGQTFMAHLLDKVQEARQRLDALGQTNCRLAVDGGVSADNGQAIARAGVDTFIAGSAIFGSQDYKATIKAIRQSIES